MWPFTRVLVNDNERHFDLAALYEALDGKRASLGMTWASVAREINAQFRDVLGHKPIAVSTIKGLKIKAIGEGDGILQMLLWLGRTPESFVLGANADPKLGQLRQLGTNQILRWDTRAIHRAIDAKRTAEGLSWADVARQIGGMGVNSGTLTRMSNGGRTAFPHVMRIVRWLGEPAANFTRASDR